MYTSHTPWWDAKNRFGLPEELDFLFGEIAGVLVPRNQLGTEKAVETIYEQKREMIEAAAKLDSLIEEEPAPAPEKQIPRALADLMASSGISEADIRLAVSAQGIYPDDVPVADYDASVINGMIIAQWDGLVNYIKQLKGE